MKKGRKRDKATGVVPYFRHLKSELLLQCVIKPLILAGLYSVRYYIRIVRTKEGFPRTYMSERMSYTVRGVYKKYKLKDNIFPTVVDCIGGIMDLDTAYQKRIRLFLKQLYRDLVNDKYDNYHKIKNG